VIQARITYIGEPMEVKVKGFRPAIKAALIRAVHAWHSGNDPDFSGQSAGFLPFHFTHQAHYRYPGVYQPRTIRYQKRKMHKYGHNKPLVFSGRTQRDVSTSISVSGTARSVHGRMPHANQALNFGGRPGMPKMRDELLAVNQQEAEALARGVDVIMTQYLSDQGAKRGQDYGGQDYS
jgi:hypothetical protein